MLVNIPRSAKQDEPLLDEIITAAGGSKYDLPWPLPNMKPATENDFWGWRSSYTFAAELWLGQKKIEIDGENIYATIMVYWVGHSRFMGGGFAVAQTNEYPKSRVLYFDWRACDHEFASRTIGNCLNRYTCSKCGKAYDVDSSG